MLTYILALVVGLGSFALYMTAFFFPELHRKGDFIWSGIGMFYALVLWVCAGRITGGVLVGQIASVGLLGWFGWQAMTLRRALTPLEQRTAIPDTALQDQLRRLSAPESLSKFSSQIARQTTNVKDWAQAVFSTLGKPKNAPADGNQSYVPAPPKAFSPPRNTAKKKPEIATQSKAETPPEIRVEGSGMEVTEDPWLGDTDSTIPQSRGSVIGSKADLSIPVQTNAGKQAIEQAAETITEDKSLTSTANTLQKASSLLTTVSERLQNTFQSLTQRKSKPIYVRKAYRTPETSEESSKPVTNPAATTQPASAVLEDTLMPADAFLEAEIEFEAAHAPIAEPINGEADPDPIEIDAAWDDIETTPDVDKMVEEQPLDVELDDADVAEDTIAPEADLDDLNASVVTEQVVTEQDNTDPDITEILHTSTPLHQPSPTDSVAENTADAETNSASETETKSAD